MIVYAAYAADRTDLKLEEWSYCVLERKHKDFEQRKTLTLKKTAWII